MKEAILWWKSFLGKKYPNISISLLYRRNGLCQISAAVSALKHQYKLIKPTQTDLIWFLFFFSFFLDGGIFFLFYWLMKDTRQWCGWCGESSEEKKNLLKSRNGRSGHSARSFSCETLWQLEKINLNICIPERYKEKKEREGRGQVSCGNL